VRNFKPIVKVSAFGGGSVALLFLAAWVPLHAVGASRHEQGAVFLALYRVAAIVTCVAAARAGLKVRRERRQVHRDQ